MCMTLRILPILLLLNAVYCSAQGPVLVRGMVRDAGSGVPLADVHIRSSAADPGTVSARDGVFVLSIADPKGVELVFSFVGYATQHLPVTQQRLADPKPLQVRMVRQAVELSGVTIERPAPEVVYQRSDLHVGDHFINDQGVWVLTYEKPRLWHREAEAGRQVYRDARLHLLDTNFVERCSVRLPTEVERLHHDHAQRTIVEGLRNAWVVEVRNGALVLQELALSALRESVLPWTDSIQGLLLGSNRSLTYPAFDHFAVDREGTSHVICAVEDKRLMELFRSQYKYMSGADKVIAMDLGFETGVDPEVIAGYMTAFYNDPYFDPPYAPLFVVSDTLCVFDHYRRTLRKFLPDGSSVGEVPITHQADKAWCDRLVQDPSSGMVYALFARNLHTWLRMIDPRTGALGPVRMLDHPFPEDVRVHDGHAFYIYRPYGSLQHRTLYRQRIK